MLTVKKPGQRGARVPQDKDTLDAGVRVPGRGCRRARSTVSGSDHIDRNEPPTPQPYHPPWSPPGGRLPRGPDAAVPRSSSRSQRDRAPGTACSQNPARSPCRLEARGEPTDRERTLSCSTRLSDALTLPRAVARIDTDDMASRRPIVPQRRDAHPPTLSRRRIVTGGHRHPGHRVLRPGTCLAGWRRVVREVSGMWVCHLRPPGPVSTV